MSNVFSIANKFQYCLNSGGGSIKDKNTEYVGTDRGLLIYFIFALLEKIRGENSYDGLKNSFDSIASTILGTKKNEGRFECVITVEEDEYSIEHDEDSGHIIFSKIGSWQSVSVPGTFNGLKEIILDQYLTDKKQFMSGNERQVDSVDLSKFDLSEIDYQVIAQDAGVEVRYVKGRTDDYGESTEIKDTSIDFEEFDFKPDYFAFRR